MVSSLEIPVPGMQKNVLYRGLRQLQNSGLQPVVQADRRAELIRDLNRTRDSESLVSILQAYMKEACPGGANNNNAEMFKDKETVAAGSWIHARDSQEDRSSLGTSSSSSISSDGWSFSNSSRSSSSREGSKHGQNVVGDLEDGNNISIIEGLPRYDDTSSKLFTGSGSTSYKWTKGTGTYPGGEFVLDDVELSDWFPDTHLTIFPPVSADLVQTLNLLLPSTPVRFVVTPLMSDQALTEQIALLESLSTLHTLVLTGSNPISTQSLTAAASLKELKEIDLTSRTAISAEGIAYLTRRLPKLTRLGLSLPSTSGRGLEGKPLAILGLQSRKSMRIWEGAGQSLAMLAGCPICWS